LLLAARRLRASQIMRTGLIALVLALSACNSTTTKPEAAPLAAAASRPAAKAAAKEAEGTRVNVSVGNFRRTVKNGQVLYCEKAEFLGSKMTKTRCLTEDEFNTFKERNRETLEDLNRAQRSVQPVNDVPSQPSGR
jgi:hypothetical protein